jgi:hypothetical protein
MLGALVKGVVVGNVKVRWPTASVAEAEVKGMVAWRNFVDPRIVSDPVAPAMVRSTRVPVTGVKEMGLKRISV